MKASYWTQPEDKILRPMFADKKTDEQISKALCAAGYDRSADAVKQRASRLGLKRGIRRAAAGTHWSIYEDAILGAMFIDEASPAEMVIGLERNGYKRSRAEVVERIETLDLSRTQRKHVAIPPELENALRAHQALVSRQIAAVFGGEVAA